MLYGGGRLSFTPLQIGGLIVFVKSDSIMLKEMLIRTVLLSLGITECTSQAGKIAKVPACTLTLWTSWLNWFCWRMRGSIMWRCGRGSWNVIMSTLSGTLTASKLSEP